MTDQSAADHLQIRVGADGRIHGVGSWPARARAFATLRHTWFTGVVGALVLLVALLVAGSPPWFTAVATVGFLAVGVGVLGSGLRRRRDAVLAVVPGGPTDR